MRPSVEIRGIVPDRWHVLHVVSGEKSGDAGAIGVLDLDERVPL